MKIFFVCARSKAQNIFCIVNESTFNSFDGLCATPSTQFHELCLCVNWILPLIHVKMPLFACFTFNFNAMFIMMLNDRIQSFCCNFHSKFLLKALWSIIVDLHLPGGSIRTPKCALDSNKVFGIHFLSLPNKSQRIFDSINCKLRAII